MHGIKVLMAKNYIDNLSEEIARACARRPNRALALLRPARLPNVLGPDGKKMIEPDPATGARVIAHLRVVCDRQVPVEGDHRDGSPGGRSGVPEEQEPVPTATIHKILRNRIYTGDFDYNGTTYRGTYEPLVSRELWEQVQAVLDGRHDKRPNEASSTISPSRA